MANRPLSFLHSAPAWWAPARQQGLVHGDAPAPDLQEPSVLVLALAMLGAIASLVPLAVFLALSLGERFLLGPGGVVLGLVFLAVAGGVLHKARHAFMNCVALVLWCTGGLLVLVNLGDVADSRLGLLLIGAVSALVLMLGAALAQMRWMQSLMGLGWGMAVVVSLMALQSWLPGLLALQLDALIPALLWCLWLRGEPARLAAPAQRWSQPRWAAFADAAIVGVLISNFASGYVARAIFWEHSGDIITWAFPAGRGLAVVVVALSTWMLAQQWRARGSTERHGERSVLLAGALLAVAAWFSTGLAVVGLVAAGALLAARWRIAVLCALLALVALGQFYYHLGWSLAAKGLGLALAGAVLLACLWALRRTADVHAAGAADGLHAVPVRRLQWVGLLVGALLALGLVNWDVRGKEQVIAQGQRILVPLIPVDPRSLMQGDYMALNFALPFEMREKLKDIVSPSQLVRASIDEQGVATIDTLLKDTDTLKKGEVALPLKRLKGQWVLVTDAYFFPEGQGRHFEQTRYGDFRVLPDGRALLVGLADADGQPVLPLPGASIWDSPLATSARIAAPDATSADSEAPVADEATQPVAVEPEPLPQAVAPAPAQASRR
ncbi:putative membrane-anchored protein [Comamonas sp. BIGb0152]|uniref:GDYXXLXY domain-containing protein n=1 Tax=Comamonas sp. BIGb0152 TaxID=2940601 RepID=UPI002169DBC4|nr:GDYXXLXY domain-containing protein [Comamonas sp. BIGb0152]MCS4296029.1 putative membrane-anchored protein [Comamonas sp. BIGb0152]